MRWKSQHLHIFKSISKIITWSGKRLSQNLRRTFVLILSHVSWSIPLSLFALKHFNDLNSISPVTLLNLLSRQFGKICHAFLILSQDVGLWGSFHFRQETTFQPPETVEDIDWDINSSSRHCHCCFNLVCSFKQVRIKKHRTTSGQKNPECLGMSSTTFSAPLTQTDAAKNHRGIPEIRISPECFSWQGIVAACYFYKCFLSRSNSLERPFWKQGL